MPPDGASATVVVPQIGADGLYTSVDRHITPAQTIWNLRSAFNVAALDCPEAAFPDLAPAYRDFLKAFSKPLSMANRTVDAEFRKQYRAAFVAHREAFMTQVYNHFALPPTLDEFCKAMEPVARDAVAVKPAGIQDFANRNLPNVEEVFDAFYRHYAQYQADVAAWDARYGKHPAPAPAPASDPASAGAK